MKLAQAFSIIAITLMANSSLAQAQGSFPKLDQIYHEIENGGDPAIKDVNVKTKARDQFEHTDRDGHLTITLNLAYYSTLLFPKLKPEAISRLKLLGRGVTRGTDSLALACVGSPAEGNIEPNCDFVRLVWFVNPKDAYLASRPFHLKHGNTQALTTFIEEKFKSQTGKGKKFLDQNFFNWSSEPKEISERLFLGTINAFNSRMVTHEGFSQNLRDYTPYLTDLEKALESNPEKAAFMTEGEHGAQNYRNIVQNNSEFLTPDHWVTSRTAIYLFTVGFPPPARYPLNGYMYPDFSNFHAGNGVSWRHIFDFERVYELE